VELDIKDPSDWYKVKKKDVYALGGEKILTKYYSSSLYMVFLFSFLLQAQVDFIICDPQALSQWYPHLELLPWLFEDAVLPGFWNKDNQRYTNQFPQPLFSLSTTL
jgi:hypothetical protein